MDDVCRYCADATKTAVVEFEVRRATVLSCTYLAHHQLESLVILGCFTVITIENSISTSVTVVVVP